MNIEAADHTKRNISIGWTREGNKRHKTVTFYHGSGPKIFEKNYYQYNK